MLTDRRTDGRTTDDFIYYKLNYEPLAQVSYKATERITTEVRYALDWSVINYLGLGLTSIVYCRLNKSLAGFLTA